MIIMTIPDIIKRCGGPDAIAEASDGKIGKWAPMKWPTIGIPEKNWELVIRLSGVSIEEIYRANQQIRDPISEPTQAAE